MTTLSLSDILMFNGSHAFFNRPMYEKTGYRVDEKDGKIFLTVNCLGVNPSDLTIESEYDNDNRNVVVVRGKTLVNDKEYKVSYRFAFVKEIDTIEHASLNGLLILEVSFKEPVKPEIKIKAK